MQQETVFNSFETFLANQISEQSFKDITLYDVPFVMLNTVRNLSYQLRNFEALYEEAPSQEISSCIKSLKIVVNEVSSVAIQLIQGNEKMVSTKSTIMYADEFDKLLKECGDKWNEANDKGAEKLSKADSFIDKAEAIFDYGDDLVGAAKWCVDELVDKVKGKKEE